MHLLEEKIRAAQNQGRVALIPYVTAGFLDIPSFWPIIMELDESGADIIEIGVPFSDPVADGPVVEAASRQALQEGVNLKMILQELQSRRKLLHAGVVLMGYYNPFLQYGLQNLVKDCFEAGVNGLIVPDLPLDEAEPMQSLLAKQDIALIALVGPNTPKERMQAYAEKAMGYAYVVSVMGVTGARDELPVEVTQTLRLAKECFSIPVALGFGLREPGQLAKVEASAQPDAAVFGSALLNFLSSGGRAAEFMAKWNKKY